MASSTRSGETGGAGDAMSAASDYVNRASERFREDLETTEQRFRAMIDEYPLTCFFGAVVAGYLLGRIATRM